MKRILSLMLVAFVVSVSAMMYAGTPIKSSDLPKAAQTFLSKHFPGEEIRKVEKGQGRRGVEYEVEFRNGTEVDFRDNGDWKEVKAARGSAVPDGVVPPAIAKHVSTNFKGQSIVEISRKRGGYEIELSNGTELRLTDEATPMQQDSNRGRRR